MRRYVYEKPELASFLREYGIPIIDAAEFYRDGDWTEKASEREDMTLSPFLLPIPNLWLELGGTPPLAIEFAKEDEGELFMAIHKTDNVFLFNILIDDKTKVIEQTRIIIRKGAPITPQEMEVLEQATHLTLCFLIRFFEIISCRNVIMEEEPHDHKRAERCRKQKRPYFRHTIIKIKPMRKENGVSWPVEYHPLLPLHIVRGHIKDFSDGPGLFGKYHGRYWWTPTLRGKAEYGIRTHDYRYEQ